MNVLAIIWLCGALPLAAFLLYCAHCMPVRPIEWVTLFFIVIGWPIFLVWVAMDARSSR